MRVIQDVRSFEGSYPELVLTIGSFDGIHRGHRRIIDTLTASARARRGTAAVMTLRPHPRQFFAPESAPNILTQEAKKESLLAEAGVDVLYYLPFGAEVAALDRADFLEEIVLQRCGARELIVGHDFAFGKGAAGNYAYLCGVAPGLGLEVVEAPALIIDGERVSSTLIRQYILQGDLAKVEKLLGRKYSVTGEVTTGRGMGRKLGFPTANIEPHNNAIPAHGVYAAEAIVDDIAYLAAVNVGIAPTLAHDSAKVEAYLLDFDGDLVGKSVEIVFHHRLRPEKKYDSLEALVAAIDADVQWIRSYFADASQE